MMRRGSAAIVPLMLAVMFMFWLIWFLGFESDTTRVINEAEHLHQLQERLAVAALKERLRLEAAHPEWDDTQLDAEVNTYINQMMVLNNIQETP
jgi:predicted PurR-regulated permease PerM